jgi:hypothetical protein
MTSKNSDCHLIQENISWSKELTKSDMEHVLICENCSQVAAEFEELDSLMKNEAIIIPEDFADNVMFKILEKESAQNSSVFETLMDIIDNVIFKFSVGGIGFLLAFSAH